jgi:propionyl-CoA carboxylase alpha chain
MSESREVRRIRKLLVANRGEIARRVMRSCRDLGIATVAVYSDADRDAPFAREADEAVALGGAAPAESYLRIDALVDAARRTGAEAVHPGYGFLAEDAGFAAACRDAALVFVGPTPEVIAQMGSKLEAKRAAAAAGVPVLATAPAGADANEPELRARAREIGFPLLVKASAGGGGRGMRLVRSEDEIVRAVAAARREAGRAFGDDTVFLEPWLEGVRHVEVQILGDAYGDVVHLFERECSVQRRHQKIVEETPSPVVDAELRGRLTVAAAALGRELGYRSAGTVEFLLANDGRFFLLEVNTRLQVEHAVTELVTGLDLVALQIRIAEGEPLPDEVRHPVARGHAIEARLCAEDPDRDLLPSSGRVARFRIPAAAGVRVDAGIEDGSEVSPHYDSLLAKIVAHAPTRDQSIRRLTAALRGLRLHGVRHNRDLLLGVLEHPDFAAGRADTGFLVANPPAGLARDARRAGADRIHAIAAAWAGQSERRASAPLLRGIPSGWRNVPSSDQRIAYATRSGDTLQVRYRSLRSGFEVAIDDEERRPMSVWAPSEGVVAVEIDGHRQQIEVHRSGEIVWVDSALGSSELRELDRFPSSELGRGSGSLAAPMPGRVVRVTVREGDTVAAGDELLVLEAMKMEHRIEAPCAGRVASVHVSAGDVVPAGAVLAVLEPASAASEG